jgi:ferredoxin
MKVWIDHEACVGNGVCAELAPDVFEFDGDLAYVRDVDGVLTSPGARALVRRGCEDAVLDAAEECPVACIHVEDA